MNAEKRPRRWLTFGLRSLFALITLTAVFFAFIGARWYRNHLERVAIEAIVAAGGKFDGDDGSNERVYLTGEQFDDAAVLRLVPHLQNLRSLKDIYVTNGPLTDKGLEALTSIARIETLYLTGTKVSDEGLAEFRRARPAVVVKLNEPDPTATRLASRTIFRHAVISAAFISSGNLLATGSGDGTLRLWNAEDPAPVRVVQAHEDWLFSIAESPSGRLLATGGGDNLIKLWRLPSLEQAGVLEGHFDDVHAVAFIDENTLASAGDDMTVAIWDIAARKERLILRGHDGSIPSLALSPDQSIIASGSRDDTIRLWSAQTGELLHTLRGHRDDVNSVAFSPDGLRLASASYDRSVRIWSVSTGAAEQVLTGHNDRVHAVAFDPSGEHLVSAARDYELRRWNLTSEESAVHQVGRTVAAFAFHPREDILVTVAAEGSVGWWTRDLGRLDRERWTTDAERGLPEGGELAARKD